MKYPIFTLEEDKKVVIIGSGKGTFEWFATDGKKMIILHGLINYRIR